MSAPISELDETNRVELGRWFSEAVQPHEATLRAWLRSRFPALIDADDLVQEAFVRIVHSHQSRNVRNPKCYLFSIAHNLAINHLRRQRNTMTVYDEMACRAMKDESDTAENVTAAQEFELLKRAIDTLPVRCREVMILQKTDGLSNREIAEHLGISVHTVNAQLVIGLERCREYLRARGVLRGRGRDQVTSGMQCRFSRARTPPRS